MRLAILVLAGCATARPEPVSNRQTAPHEAPQHLGTLVVAELTNGCPLPHPIAILVDDVVRATVEARCKPPQVPNANGVIIVTSDDEPETTGPAIEVAPGHHVLVVRDAITGLSDRHELDFPAFDTTTPKALSNMVLVIVHDDWLKSGLVIKERMIRL
jgi:hypothetical protein